MRHEVYLSVLRQPLFTDCHTIHIKMMFWKRCGNLFQLSQVLALLKHPNGIKRKEEGRKEEHPALECFGLEGGKWPNSIAFGKAP